jgi:hypothetical protein
MGLGEHRNFPAMNQRSYQILLLPRLATPPILMGSISKQDDKMVHKRALYAFPFPIHKQ